LKIQTGRWAATTYTKGGLFMPIDWKWQKTPGRS